MLDTVVHSLAPSVESDDAREDVLKCGAFRLRNQKVGGSTSGLSHVPVSDLAGCESRNDLDFRGLFGT